MSNTFFCWGVLLLPLLLMQYDIRKRAEALKARLDKSNAAISNIQQQIEELESVKFSKGNHRDSGGEIM